MVIGRSTVGTQGDGDAAEGDRFLRPRRCGIAQKCGELDINIEIRRIFALGVLQNFKRSAGFVIESYQRA